MARITDDLVRGMEDIIAHNKGEKGRATSFQVTPPKLTINPRAIRVKQALSQREFSQRYGIPQSTLENWEQAHREPDATARAYLVVVDEYPDEVAAVIAKRKSALVG